MAKPQRPTLRPPANNSILDEITETTANRPPGRPPFAPRDPDPTPPAQPAPAAAEPDPEPEERTPPPPPAQTRRAARPARTARPAARRPAPGGIPEPPPGYIDSTKPLQVYLNGADHWNLKYGVLVRGTDMSTVVGALVSAFTHDPDTWTALMARAEEERVPLGELLAPHLAAAIEDQG